MCRIAGIINPALGQDQLALLIKGMCDLQQHGGPDDEGVYINRESGLALGHRRLSIIDTSSAGHQPMSFADDRYLVTYNGEIYNYEVLRHDLELAGARFKSNSDTEVILAAYAYWGVAAFERFNGMFAFGIWDNHSRELVLARGGAGIKPLYYAHTNEGFAFASEIRAFAPIGYLRQENPDWPVYLMAYGHLPEPVTPLQKVVPLPKGCYLKYNPAANSLVIKSFTRSSFLEKISNRREAIYLVKQQLEEAVQRHLVSDAPIGVFLSGGLDSSIIALLAKKHSSRLNTISIYFEDKLYSEKSYQDLLLQQLSCSNQQFLLQEKDFHTYLPSIIGAMDMPCCDGINTWFISKYARETGLKSVLSGIGGDELFGGYPSFNRIKTALALEKLPNKVLRAGRFANAKKFKRLCYLSIHNPVGRYLFLRGQFIPKDIAMYLGATEESVWDILSAQPKLPDIDYLAPQNQASWMETHMYMQNQLLRDADTMGMVHGLEIRVPFLDKEFFHLALSIQSDIKFSGRFGKQLLIDAFKDILPEPIWNRPKMGFSFPFKEWLSDEKYAHAGNKDLSVPHQQLKQNHMHWSQFFTLLLMQEYHHA